MFKSSPENIVLCLAGDMCADPGEIVEIIRENNLTAQFREAVNNFASGYPVLLEAVNSLC